MTTLNEQAISAAISAFYEDEGKNDSGVRAAVVAYLTFMDAEEGSHASLTARVAELEKALEPFALCCSEGVVTAAEGHVTVTTCAEYFHRARAALNGGDGK